MRFEVCASDDHYVIARLLEVIRDLGGHVESEDSSLGVGLHRFRFPEGELTVFVDAWLVDAAGPDELAHRVQRGLVGEADGCGLE